MKMSKMRMPEMKAVRFEESDVICASNRITLNKFGNRQNGDAYVRYMGVNYGNTQGGGQNIDAFYATFNSDHPYAYIDQNTKIGFETAGGGYIDFYGAQALDNASASSEGIDGPYVWNGQMFEKQ